MPPRINKQMCGICKKIIFIPGDEYCILSQYKKDNKLQGEGYYHVQCFRETHLQTQNLKAQAENMLARTFKVLEKVEGRV